jgi:hypothetical protein
LWWLQPTLLSQTAAPLQQQLSLPETVQIHCSSVILQEQLWHHQMRAKRITNNLSILYFLLQSLNIYLCGVFNKYRTFGQQKYIY